MVEQAYSLPTNLKTLPDPLDKDTVEGLKILVRKGMKYRGLEGKQEYEDRLQEELDVILEKDLSVYFIIVWDIMRFCRKRGHATGFARGSAAGSLICYVLQITEVDPLKYGLLFWRFLDPDRDDTADIDLDFEDSCRQDVKQYLSEKYGVENVCDIATFQFFSAKSAFKAACKVMSVPYAEANDLTKEIEELQDLRRSHLKDFHERYPDVFKITEHLIGRISGTGKHASGFIISNEPIAALAPVESRKVKDEESRAPALALDKDDADEVGFVKIDLLGIKMLTVISDTVKRIKANHGKLIDYKSLPEDDMHVYDMLSDGFTVGVFQAEESASTNLIKKMKITSFDDLVVSNALVRAGAWNSFGEEYLARKKGFKPVTYPTPKSKEFLEFSLGLWPFQEQSMLLCSEVAGTTKAEANQIRRLTSKKKSKEELKPYMDKFINGCVANGVKLKEAKWLWNTIETTAEYQFNKCLAEDTRVQVTGSPDFKIFKMTLTMKELYDRIGSGEQLWVQGPTTLPNEITQNSVEPTWHKIKDVHDNGVQSLYRISIDSKTYIDSTSEHKHMLTRWVPARLIHQNDLIWTEQGKQKVAGRKYVGQGQTYDLELETEPHAFYANGFMTHNSHSVSYSKLTYVTAWLKYYYPAEFLTSLLNRADGDSISDYLGECNRLGLEIKTPDVNNSELGYINKGKAIYMGLSNIKFISDKLGERLINLRPIASYEELREKIFTKNSGLSSRVLDALNKVGAAEFDDHPVDREACKTNYYEYLGIASFDEAQVTQEMRTRITSFIDYNEGDTCILTGIVKDIVAKSGWIRVDFTDGTGKAGFFVGPNHGFVKGKKYILVVAKKNITGVIDLEEFSSSNAILKYLNGTMTQGTWFVCGKSRLTKAGNPMGTIVFSHMGKLRYCTVYNDKMSLAKSVKPGDKIKISINETGKWGPVLEGIKLDG